MSNYENSRRVSPAKDKHATAASESVEAPFLVCPTTKHDICSTEDAQTASGQRYTENEERRRKREAQARIRRTREHRHAAKYFYGLQRGCARRA